MGFACSPYAAMSLIGDMCCFGCRHGHPDSWPCIRGLVNPSSPEGVHTFARSPASSP